MAAISLKCPHCGGGLQFDPAGQNYKCEYCLSKFTQEELEKLASAAGAGGEETEAAGPDPALSGETSQAEGAVIYHCPSCGAELVTDETSAAAFCFYCHNPVILKGRLEGEYHPDYVIPFAIDKEKATEIFLEWLKKKRYVPADFYGPKQIEKLTGVYFPYWLYSCRVEGKLEGEASKLRVWRVGNIEHTETKQYDISRSGSMPVSHLTRNALKKADKKLAAGVMPFETQNMKPFSMGFLTGFLAEKRDIEQAECAPEVEQEVRTFAEASLKDSIEGYDRVSVSRSEAVIREPKWEYALLPVWTLTYKEKKTGKIYYFACNGQSGKVCGELPVDPKKLRILFAKIFLPLLAVLLAVGYFI